MSIRKHTAKTACHTAKHLLICAAALAIAVNTACGGTWRDSFDDNTLKDWKRDEKRNGATWNIKWEARNGRLEARVERNPMPDRPPEAKLGHALAFLELTTFKLQEEHLVVEGISETSRPMNLGIAIGIRLPMNNLWDATVYSFRAFRSRGNIYKMSFTRGGGSRGYKIPKIDYAPPPNLGTARIEHLKVAFDTGRFQVYWDDQLVAKVVDEEIKTVDLVGLMIMQEGRGSAGLDEFVISGPRIPSFRSINKLATTWGKLKTR